jgi:hypothetical protein
VRLDRQVGPWRIPEGPEITRIGLIVKLLSLNVGALTFCDASISEFRRALITYNEDYFCLESNFFRLHGGIGGDEKDASAGAHLILHALLTNFGASPSARIVLA